MFKKSEFSLVRGKIENLLGQDTSFSGTIKSDGNLRVDAVYQGRIETGGNLIVGPSGKVSADIVANGVQVWGAVRGNIVARGRLEILPTGHVWGDIRVGSLLIDEGGVFRGKCVMVGDGEEATVLLESGEAELGFEPSEVAAPVGEVAF